MTKHREYPLGYNSRAFPAVAGRAGAASRLSRVAPSQAKPLIPNADDIDISVCDICGGYYEWHKGLVGNRCDRCSRL